jgi:Na+/glutamate symporter
MTTNDNELTPIEVHAAILGCFGFLLGITRAWSQIRKEPWYAFASFITSLVIGIIARKRYYEIDKERSK